MKIWEEPEVEVLAYSRLNGGPFGWTTNDEGHVSPLDALPEIGGRVCYLSYGKGRKSNREYLANILAQGHESVLEHSVVTFGIRGISRSCSHEVVRHRHLSFSQTSQRYVTQVDFVKPPNYPTEVMDEFSAYCSGVGEVYKEALELLPGVGKENREVSRFILPNCTATNMVVTGNLRTWRHFCKIRGGVQADAEIRKLAHVIFMKLRALAPNVFQDMEIRDGEVQTVRAA
jgi:thymidylate synthase (FAD)